MKSNISKDSSNHNINLQFSTHKYDSKLINISEKAFPKVFLTKRMTDNLPVVLKLFEIEEKFLLENYTEEIKKCLQFVKKSYNNIVEFFSSKGKSFFELCLLTERGDLNLSELITSISETVPKSEHEIIQIFTDVIDSLQYAHQNNFAHGNIHPNNIIIYCTSNERPKDCQKFNVFSNNIYKLTDWKLDFIFHMQKKIKGSQEIFPKNSFFRSPEYFNHKEKHEIDFKASDIYSLGMCILHCCGVSAKKLLPISISEKEIHDIQLQKIFAEISQFYDGKLVEILKNCLNYDHVRRWNAATVLNALKNFSKASTMDNTFLNHENDHINAEPEKKNKKGLLKKLFSGILKGKKSKQQPKVNENHLNMFSHNEIAHINEYNFNTKNFSLQIFSLEDYNAIFPSKYSKPSK